MSSTVFARLLWLLSVVLITVGGSPVNAEMSSLAAAGQSIRSLQRALHLLIDSPTPQSPISHASHDHLLVRGEELLLQRFGSLQSSPPLSAPAPAQHFTQRLDHFDRSVTETWQQVHYITTQQQPHDPQHFPSLEWTPSDVLLPCAVLCGSSLPSSLSPHPSSTLSLALPLVVLPPPPLLLLEDSAIMSTTPCGTALALCSSSSAMRWR